MEAGAVLTAWRRILSGYRPNLTIEITRECPLRCPGCYAYGEQHLGGSVVLRELADFKGQELIDHVIDVIDRYRPIHISFVGGEPLVRFRELDVLLPMLTSTGRHVQVVTSAVRPIPAAWARMPNLQVCVSIDGLQPEHDARRAPATYDRILKHIAGQQVTIHTTVTRQQSAPGYLTKFVEIWAPNPDVKRIWFSLYTPQRGEDSAERLRPVDRERVVAEIAELETRYEKLADMRPPVTKRYLATPQQPSECIFAKTTACLSADLTHAITPCQFGGSPECRECGCLASVGFSALGDYKVGGVLPLRTIFNASFAVGAGMRRLRGESTL